MLKHWDLKFWESGEWQVVDERLKDMEKRGEQYCPVRRNLFSALELTPFEKVRCVLVGQDPYPSLIHATGLAFSVPPIIVDYPPTLQNIFKELKKDLHCDDPPSGDLTKWTQQGVLLWNAIPSCTKGKSLSHRWPEWECLTAEIIKKLNERAIVFAFLGSVARDHAKYVDLERCEVVVTSHPSPRGSLNSKSPFLGSRLFSTINGLMVQHGQEPIDWRL